MSKIESFETIVNELAKRHSELEKIARTVKKCISSLKNTPLDTSVLEESSLEKLPRLGVQR